MSKLGLPGWAWSLLLKHVSGRHSRASVKVMNLFAFLGLFIGSMAWISVAAIMEGLQGDIRTRALAEKPHLLWEGTPRAGLGRSVDELDAAWRPQVSSIRYLLQTEALLEVPTLQGGRVVGSGVVLQGVDRHPPREFSVGLELVDAVGLIPGQVYRFRSAWKIDAPPLELPFESTFRTGVYELDRGLVRIARSDLETWLGLPGAVSRVEIKVEDPDRVEALRAPLAAFLGVELKTWRETDAALWYSLRLEKILMNIAVFFIVVLASIAVHLALAVRVAEKSREIALLRGLGARVEGLGRLYLFEGAFFGVAGGGLGCLAAYFFCRFVSGSYRLPDFYYMTEVPVAWSPLRAALIVAVTILVALAASWVPARRVLRVEISQGLRS